MYILILRKFLRSTKCWTFRSLQFSFLEGLRSSSGIAIVSNHLIIERVVAFDCSFDFQGNDGNAFDLARVSAILFTRASGRLSLAQVAKLVAAIHVVRRANVRRTSAQS